jgi:hypothetical protein
VHPVEFALGRIVSGRAASLSLLMRGISTWRSQKARAAQAAITAAGTGPSGSNATAAAAEQPSTHR